MCVTLAAASLIATGVSAASSAYGAYKQGKSEKSQLKANQKAAQYEAQVAEENARDAIFRGELSAQSVQRTASQVAGAQRSGFAGAGVDVNYGTAADLQDETNFFGQIDAARERYNAGNEAKGLRQQGAQAAQQAKEYKKAAGNVNPLLNAGTSLLGSAGSVASKWSSFRTPAASTSYTSGGYSPSATNARLDSLLGR